MKNNRQATTVKPKADQIPTQHSHPHPHPSIPPSASAVPELVKPQERIPVPANYRGVLLSLFHHRQSSAKQVEILQSQLRSLEQQAVNANGELTGLVKGIVIAEGLDQNANWDLSSDCTHLIKIP